MDFGPAVAAGSNSAKGKAKKRWGKRGRSSKLRLPLQKKKILQRITKSEWALYENESLSTILESNQAGFNARARAW